jgi:hypothetical protein
MAQPAAQSAAHQEGAQAQGEAQPLVPQAPKAADRLPPSDSYSSLGLSYL